MNLKSIRWKLSLTYAGIALVAALAMGAVLLLTLRGYYNEQERSFLEKNARTVSLAVAPLLLSNQPPEGLDSQFQLLGFLSQVRVRLLNAEGRLVMDSGVPGQDRPIVVSAVADEPPFSEKIGIPSIIAAQPDPGERTDGVYIQREPDRQLVLKLGWDAVSRPADGNVVSLPAEPMPGKLQFFYRQTGDGFSSDSIAVAATRGEDGETSGRTLVAVIPAAGTMYGFDLQAGRAAPEERSSQSVSQQIISDEGKVLGTIVISDGPAIGSEIVAGVARGGVVAALAAVLIAAAAGWWVSRKMSAPLTELTESTRRMSTGDLSVRAPAASADEFGDLARAFNEMADRVEGIVGSLRRFASDAAHELQTPLTALNTNLELAAREQPGNAYLEQARGQFQRLEALAANLLDLSRLEGGDLPAFAPVNLADLLKEVGERYASEAEQARKLFYLEIPEGEVRVAGDAGQLKRALTNLLDNALKFTPPGGTIEAGAMEEEGLVRMWVEDNGAGVPEEDRPHLFERFHRGRNAADLPGSGLGLAIVQAIAERHGGRVWFEAQSPGAKFWVELPAGSVKS